MQQVQIKPQNGHACVYYCWVSMHACTTFYQKSRPHVGKVMAIRGQWGAQSHVAIYKA